MGMLEGFIINNYFWVLVLQIVVGGFTFDFYVCCWERKWATTALLLVVSILEGTSPDQSRKTRLPNVRSESGIVIDFSPEQYAKAS